MATEADGPTETGGKISEKKSRGREGISSHRGIMRCGKKEQREERYLRTVSTACSEWLRGRGLMKTCDEMMEAYASRKRRKLNAKSGGIQKSKQAENTTG
jgi:hypothetical protein